jgi:NADH-quinone oxidoreductase subunit E
MMVEARKDQDKEPVVDNAASDVSSLAQASSKLFAEQAAAMAMMTAYGMSVAAQMTGMMLGALRGPTSVDEAEKPKSAEPKAAPVAESATGKVVELRPRAPKTAESKPALVAKVAEKPVKKAAKQSAKTKVAPAKAPEPKPVAPVDKAAPKVAIQAATDRDDLKKIPGIGPRLEQELNARGITRYADLGGLSKAAVKKLDAELELEGRITRDDWAGQAKALSGGKG